jgi:short subunit dehydrogenase-like uncharacterized protein
MAENTLTKALYSIDFRSSGERVATTGNKMRTPTLIIKLVLLQSMLSWTAHCLSTGNPKFVILGGTGKIGTAVAAHLVKRLPSCDIVLVGRRSGEEAIRDIQQATATTTNNPQLSFQCIDNIWKAGASLQSVLRDATVVIHTAGPYAEETPTVLDAAIAAKVPVYVDVSDPLAFLDASLERFEAAVNSQTTALCAAGAFPGMSNVLAMEAAAAAAAMDTTTQIIQNVRFNYFTKGLGGSGTINLYITNLGFGDFMTQYDQGQLRAFEELSGKLLGTVDFFLDSDNSQAKERVGTEQVFAWPFPEAATVARELKIQGSSSAAMGTAPAIWNYMLGLLVDIVPRPWWRSKRFSKFMADFSQPLVLLTDAILQNLSPDNVGETHAMRIDVTSEDGQMFSIVQAHESFRQCVGQSCAEFALDFLEHPNPGVYLPEQRYRQADDRARIIEKLTTTPGTFAYTGPVRVERGATTTATLNPSNIEEVVARSR